MTAFETLRNLILSRPPRLNAQIRERFPAEPTGEGALAFALEFHLNPAYPAMDGWKLLRLTHETVTSMRVVGLIHVLPVGVLPLEVELLAENDAVTYRLRVGSGDAQWSSLSDSKRWNAVYLYAVGEHGEQWVWSEPTQGSLENG